MKKNMLIFIFIFMTGLFSGLFFCTGINSENRLYLSELLIDNMQSEHDSYFFHFSKIILSHLKLFFIMLPALFLKVLCFLPPAVLFCRSFALGCCCGLIYISDIDNPFFFSLFNLLPQNILYVPAYILFAYTVFNFCIKQKNRPLSLNDKDLLTSLVICILMIAAGCFIETVFR